MDKLPQHASKWLKTRGITSETLERSGIHWRKEAIAIPVLDENKELLFHKYRQDPRKKDGEKYFNDTGASISLYNRHLLKEKLPAIWIMEGEMDALRADSIGLPAVSTTGGTNSFQSEWVDLFRDTDEIYVCYDNDDPGLRGALKTIMLLGRGKLMLLPESVGEHGDFTDYVNGGGDPLKLISEAVEIPIVFRPIDRPRELKKKEIESAIKDRQANLKLLLAAEEEIFKNTGREKILKWIIGKVENEIYRMRKLTRNSGFTGTSLKENILAAKEVPLENLFDNDLDYQGNRAVGICPFHSEKTGSFTIYLDTNTWHCFGCDAGRDPIDFVMQRDEVDFTTAVKTLSV